MEEKQEKKTTGKKKSQQSRHLKGKEPIFWFFYASFLFILCQLSAADSNGDYFKGITSEDHTQK